MIKNAAFLYIKKLLFQLSTCSAPLHIIEKVDTNPIGTDPFKPIFLPKRFFNSHKAFDDDWEDQTKIARLVFAITPDISAYHANLKKGECQVMPYPNPADIAKMKKDPNLVVHEKDSFEKGVSNELWAMLVPLPIQLKCSSYNENDSI
ncbi:ABC transporter substrate-binding protein [Gallibacterium melopsittaci]|uniref:ABC transporter substrate-binding protein n=1 Tax=Gallibacterium melopsittaci TaxID=516063 RepID=A0ABV6HUJ4_9PAST